MSKTEINKLQGFLKRPKDKQEVLEDVADFAIMAALLRLVSDRVSLWKREKALGVFLTSCNSTINHIDGLNSILKHYLTSIIDAKDIDAFSELQTDIEIQLLTYFESTSKTILGQLQENTILV